MNGSRLVIKPKRVIAFVSDTHVLSDFALCPDGLVNYETGKNISAMRSGGQLQLLDAWRQFLRVCDMWHVDTVVHLGDAVAGVNPKECGRNVMDTDLEVQKDGFVLLMKPLVKDRVYHQVSGTRYHEARDSRIHKDLVDRLRPVCKEAYFHHSIANIHIRGTSKTMNIAHACTSASIYRGQALERESFFIMQAEAEGLLPHIDYVVRGHLHRFLHVDNGYHHLIFVPGWMAWFPYRDKVGLYGRMQPHIGGVILFIDEKNRTTVHHYLYETPKIVDFVKEG